LVEVIISVILQQQHLATNVIRIIAAKQHHVKLRQMKHIATHLLLPMRKGLCKTEAFSLFLNWFPSDEGAALFTFLLVSALPSLSSPLE
jgi:hypothetical protein